ncbi:alpha/beta fold hydrolase [Streptomyces kebangsaanensis]|uniref:alpha/beta fold hydrolase n=1 Tax=Streptomyces kebangsaanensis TaxID=864058 RepID=UPI0013013A92|nr:alpha/beta hydrolase [Streptomyces kebangsaanensis]
MSRISDEHRWAGSGTLSTRPRAAASFTMRRTVPDGRSVTVEGTAHCPNTEKPGAFNRIVTDFLRVLPPGARPVSARPAPSACTST